MESRRKLRVGLITSVIDNRTARGTALVGREFLTRILESEEFDFTLIHHEQCDDPLYKKHPTILIPHLIEPFDRQMFREVWFWLRERFRGTHFDVVHYLNPRVWPSYLLTTSDNVVITMHEAGVMFDLGPRGIGDYLFRLTNRFLHFRMSMLIAVSECGRQEIIKKCHIDPARVVAIYNGLPSTFIQDMEAPHASSHFIPPTPFVLSIGRLAPHKNIVRLLHAYAQARTHGIRESLVLVGGRHFAGYVKEVEDTIQKLGLADFVVIAPYIPVPDLPHLYRSSRALIYPSTHEGFGLPLLEAMASGTPATAANATSLPEIAGGTALLFDPYNVNEMSDALVRILTDEELRADLIQRGYERIKDFSWEKGAEQVLALYRSFATKSNSCS